MTGTENLSRPERAYRLFLEGCNCSQAVFCAFCDLVGLDEKTALRLSSSFGGGMGRLREVCGAVSGMLMAAGALYGYSDVKDPALKSEHYKLVQYLAGKFSERAGSYVCRELLGLKGASDPVSPPRDADFYRTRPCPGLIKLAAEILDEYIAEHPL